MAVNNFTDTDLFEAKIKKLASDHKLVMAVADVVVSTRRLTESYNCILGALLVRGLTKAQVDTWDRGEEFQLDIATYWYAKDSGWGGKHVEDEDWTTVFDRRKELETVPIVGSNVLLESPGVAVGMDLLEINETLNIRP